jgi:hypothetical protein
MEVYLVTAELSIRGKEECGFDFLSAKIIADDGMSAKSIMFDHIEECEIADGKKLVDGSRTTVLPAHMSSVRADVDACIWCHKSERMVFSA